ncbi:nitroreductase family protein [Mycoplasmopsis columbinasalis]|uniref:Putative NADPH-dependent oxidoreductase n=1 Tax=Mycoplasmopsis columbinasalis TaxID=114880 RepID=A0A449BA38_9BACT|nr:nitroreductase family protein [Mycoplasmopsis columbinasalis]VEU78060.1 putative NADPH-dependent oxidoreductase [Mycoplasmopsis columbinasalis]
MSFIVKNKLRNSAREYDLAQQPLKAEALKAILETIQNAPTSNNFFSSSVVVVTDTKLLAELGQILKQKQVSEAGAFLIFLADFNRLAHITAKTNYKEKLTQNDLLVAFGDAFIQATMAQDAATELGLGTCFIGGVREHIDKIKELLNVTGIAFPAVGLTVGVPKKVAHTAKPKLNRVYQNTYNQEVLADEIKAYDEVIKNYYQEHGINGDYSNYAAEYLTKKHENQKILSADILEAFNLKTK